MPSSVARSVGTLSALATVIFAVYYQLILKELLTHAGYWRTAEALNNQQCTTVPELQACEKSVLHKPSGVLYLACSTPASRVHWVPSMGRLNASGRSLTDYVATYDPATSKITHLKVTGFPSSVPLALHGFDVVPSDADPLELFVYLVNHRPHPEDSEKYGADSVIEIFKAKVGGDTLAYVSTVEDRSVMISPNDLVGYGDGKSFHFTNDHRAKRGMTGLLDLYLRLPGKSVGYCHLEEGCKFAAKGLRGANGIVRGNDGLYFVNNDSFGEVFVLERQDDSSLVLTDIIKTDRPMDNISMDENGVFYIAGFPNGLQFLKETAGDPTIPSPSSVLRLSRNTGSGQFYGEKYKVTKIFEDDGKVASAVTTAIWDAKRKRLYLTGLSSFHMTICKVDNL